jgi:hypothetical protein
LFFNRPWSLLRPQPCSCWSPGLLSYSMNSLGATRCCPIRSVERQLMIP